MNLIPSPLANAFAALAAELRLRAGDGTGQGAQPALHALILLGLIRVLWVLESMVRHWHATRLVPAAGHTLLAARYPRAPRPRRPLTPRIRADLKAIARPYRAPAAATMPRRALPRRQPPRHVRPRAMPRVSRTLTLRPPGSSKRAFQPVPNHALFIAK